MLDRISMVGLGYIGLPTAAVFAAAGTEVIGLDVSPMVVETINAGRVHIIEPDLEGLVHRAVTRGRLRATLTAEEADAFVIAVPTPLKDGNQPDVSYVEEAGDKIAPVLKAGDLVVLESTSPVGTTEALAQRLAAARPDLSFPQDAGEAADVQLAFCLERVLPGQIVRELVENDRIIGGMTARANELAVALYKKVVRGECVVTDTRTAEMCKLTENSSRDVQIAFANELSMICDEMGIDVWELISLANRHPRVDILRPGAGVGGHCIAVDPWFVVASTPDQATLIRTARERNCAKPDWVLEKVKAAIMTCLSASPERPMADVKVACLGLAFKPDIDDLRESPALQIAENIAALGVDMIAVEPHIDALPHHFPSTAGLADLATATAQADVICVLVKHTAFVNARSSLTDDPRVIDVVGLAR